MNNQNQLIPNEQDGLPQIQQIIQPLFYAAASTALSFLFEVIGNYLYQPSSLDNENKNVDELSSEGLFDGQLHDLLTKLDSSQEKQEIINKFIDDNFTEITNHPRRSDLVSNIQDILSSSDTELIKDQDKSSKLIFFFDDLKRSGLPKTFNKFAKILVAKKMSDIILCDPKYGGYMNHLCFNQEFKLLTSLLEGSDPDIIGKQRVRSIAKKKDSGHLNANLLECSAIMGTVATDKYLEEITKLYSKFPPKKMILTYLMLNPESFKEIFNYEYFEERKRKNKPLVITDFNLGFVKESMDDVDLHHRTKYTKNGYEGTTLEDFTVDSIKLYNALKEGKGIMVKKEMLDSLNSFFFQMRELVDDKMKDQILIAKGNAVGIVKSALADQKSIKDVAEDNVRQNLKYLKETLEKIEKPSQNPFSPKVSSSQKTAKL